MKQAVNIMFLGGAKRVSMGRMLIAAGAQLGMEVNLFSYELSREVPVAEIATVIIGRRWNDPELAEHLHSVVEENAIDILLPFVDPAVEVAIRYCASDPEVWTPGGNAEMARLMFNKSEADSLFRQLGIPVPDAADTCSKDCRIIAKPRFGSASKGLRILSLDEYHHFALTEESSGFLCQRYIEKRKEYTVDCYVAHNGEIICAVPRIRLEIAGGEVVSTQTIHDEEIEQLSHKLLHQLKLTGPVTLQFLREINPDGTLGRAMLMEVNPRLGGGAVCAVHAGADIPLCILKEFAGKPLTPCRDWADVKICRYMQEVVFRH